MKICLPLVFLGVCALASAQLDRGGILGGGLGGGGLGGGGLGGGGLGGEPAALGGGQAPGGAARAGGTGGMNPMNTMLMSSMMSDPSAHHFPAMMMMQKNPQMMSNPMGALMMSSLMGTDVHKIAAPMAMMNAGRGGGGAMNMMRWMPLMSGDPSMMGLALSMGMGGMGGGGMGGGLMNPLSLMMMANA